MLTEVRAGVVVPCGAAWLSSVGSLKKQSWQEYISYKTSLIWQITLLFWSLTSCFPASPSFFLSLFSLLLFIFFFPLPYFVPSELGMKSHCVWVTRRWTQSHVWLPGDLQGQLWSCVCWCCPRLNWALVKLLAAVQFLFHLCSEFHWVLPSLGICVTWGCSGLRAHSECGSGYTCWKGCNQMNGWLIATVHYKSFRQERGNWGKMWALW